MTNTYFAGQGISLDGLVLPKPEHGVTQETPKLDAETLPDSFRSATSQPSQPAVQYDAAKTAGPTTPESIALKHGITQETLTRLQDAFITDEFVGKWIHSYNNVPAFRQIMADRAVERGRRETDAVLELGYDVRRREHPQSIADEFAIDKNVIEDLRAATLKHKGPQVFGPGYELRTESYEDENSRVLHQELRQQEQERNANEQRDIKDFERRQKRRSLEEAAESTAQTIEEPPRRPSPVGLAGLIEQMGGATLHAVSELATKHSVSSEALTEIFAPLFRVGQDFKDLLQQVASKSKGVQARLREQTEAGLESESVQEKLRTDTIQTWKLSKLDKDSTYANGRKQLLAWTDEINARLRNEGKPEGDYSQLLNERYLPEEMKYDPESNSITLVGRMQPLWHHYWRRAISAYRAFSGK